MTIIGELAEKVKRFPAAKLVKETFLEYEEELEDYNTAQLERGLESTGKNIAPEYTPFTVEIKKLKGQPYDRVTLKDTGAFHKSLDLKVTLKKFEFKASDKKTTKITQKYGEKIFGLTEESKRDFQTILLEEMQEKTREYFAK